MRRMFQAFLPLLFIPAILYSQTSPDCSAVTIVSATNNGTNTVATYFESNGIRNGNDYFGATVYYPQDTTSMLTSIIIIPGYANYESSMQNWGPFLASHGIVCMTIGTNSIWDLVNARKEALQDALISLKAENTRINSPLFNKLDTNRIALGGWSMGGGGAQLAAVEDSTIKAIIALCPWIVPAQITINSLNHNSPTLFFSGQIDAIAPTNTHANVHYNYTPNTTDKLLYEITLGGHTVANSPSGGQGEVGRMALSWLKRYLIEDFCYCPLLLDTPATASVYQTNITCPIYGCTDPLASNYDPLATIDDGSCTYPNTCGAITGVHMTDVIHDRAWFNWDNINSSTCDVDQIRFRYRAVGTSSYSTKTMGVPVGSGCNTSNTSKLVLGLSPSTTYEYDFKIWYCNASAVNWHAGGTFTTLPLCDNVINVVPTPITTTKTQFCWDSVSTYAFVRLQYRENVPGSSFSNIGGMGVFSPILCKEKNGLTPGLNYRVMWRTWCSPNGGPYRSAGWDGPVLWTQPTSIRVEGGTSINNLEIYPNPSRDVFNVEFTSETKQTIEVRLVNLVGEIIFTENLVDFEGEYTHSFNLSEYSKGIYLLELDTDNGIVNKKLILQ